MAGTYRQVDTCLFDDAGFVCDFENRVTYSGLGWEKLNERLRFVQTACNAHAELVRAVEQCEAALGIRQDFTPLGRAGKVAPVIRAALARAKGVPTMKPNERDIIADLVKALEEVIGWIDGQEPAFTEDPEWHKTLDKVEYALGAAKQP